jgi:hypothetical protein
VQSPDTWVIAFQANRRRIVAAALTGLTALAHRSAGARG